MVWGDELKFANELQTKVQAELIEYAKLQTKLRGESVRYEVTTGTNLFYKLVVGPDLNVQPAVEVGPKRGELAFQTDFLICKKVAKGRVPLVAVELKYGDFSTHDVLTYSAKALKHKEVYPYLRYGFVIGAQKNQSVNRKFFVHNVGFDFALAVKNVDDARLLEVLKRQIETAEVLIRFWNKNSKFSASSYETTVQIK